MARALVLLLSMVTSCKIDMDAPSKVTPWALVGYYSVSGKKHSFISARFDTLESCLKIKKLYERPCRWELFDESSVLDCRGHLGSTPITCEEESK